MIVSGKIDVVRKKSDRHRVALLALPGGPLFEFAIPCEVFGVDRRDVEPGWYEFWVVAAVPGVCLGPGLTMSQPADLSTLERADTIVVPACQMGGPPIPPPVLEGLRAAAERGARLVSICSGAFVLAEAGLLDGRRAATHWMHAPELRARHPLVRVDDEVLYVHDGVWTSAGSAAGMDLCLELVRQDFGGAVANAVARRMVIAPHRDGNQAQFINAPATGTWSSGNDLQHWARQHLATVTVSSMAARAGLSERTLVRRFHSELRTTPQRWIQRERLAITQELLEATDMPLDAIARRVGLGTTTNLRQQFARAFETTPSAYRARFAHASRPHASLTSRSG